MNSSKKNYRGGKKFFKRNNPPRNVANKNLVTTQPEQLLESDAGITEYVSKMEGFSGILKARYSDFHVNEINLDNEIAKLTTTRFEEEVTKEEDKVIPKTTPNEDIPQDIWDEILNTMEGSEDKIVELEVTQLSKDRRGDIHSTVKSIFKHKIIISTLTKGDKKVIEFKKWNKIDKIDTRISWPKNRGEYAHFLVYKENIDTLEATMKIGDCLKMKPSAFNYAGIKDRRAKATQWFCVRKVEPWKLLRRTRHLRNIHIGNITFKNEPLKLGQLKGNRFRIALRNICASDSLINNAVESLKENGFINYYGLQRFGNDKEVPTYEIGLQLMSGNFKEACNLILKCKTCDKPDLDISKAKKIYNETGDAAAANECFNDNENKCVESKLLQGLAKSNVNDYVNALENLPRNMRLLYIHAFQSLIWNKIVSKRIKTFGLKAIAGDLIIIKNEIVPEILPETEKSVTESETEVEEADDEKENSKISQEVKILGEDDLENYTIYDIVLPLPGYDIIYPENVIKEWYKEMLEGYGLSLEMPKQSVKTYTLSGSYRHIVSKVKNLEWKIVHYADPNDNLIRSDFEELRGEKEPEDQPDGRYKALIIDFCLNSSCYATMVVREILKTETSSSAHAKLNNYHEQQIPTLTDSKPVICAQPESLLSDPAKFEAFKNSIFGMSDEASLKRKTEDETVEIETKKKKSNETEEEETCLKLEPALV